jgi:hypothetical protein
VSLLYIRGRFDEMEASSTKDEVASNGHIVLAYGIERIAIEMKKLDCVMIWKSSRQKKMLTMHFEYCSTLSFVRR